MSEPNRTASNFFDHSEVHTSVAVQVLTNSKTGATSIGWIRDTETIKQWTETADEVD